MLKSSQWLVASRYKLALFWQWVRFGSITEKVVATAGDNVVAEVAYYGRKGRMVGYWAYGYFDPKMPYQG